jgi:hypothetical protein
MLPVSASAMRLSFYITPWGTLCNHVLHKGYPEGNELDCFFKDAGVGMGL